VFQKRNTSYGAYELRRQFAKNQFGSLIVTLSVFIGLLLWVYVSYDNSKAYDFEFEQMVEFKGFDANLISVKPLKKEQAPPLKVPEEKPIVEVKNKNLPPEVKKDKPEPEVPKEVSADTSQKVSEKTGTDDGKKYEAGLDSGIVKPIYEEGPASPYGGLAEFMKWVQQNLKVPKEAMDNNVHGTVYVHFTIDTTGIIIRVTLSKGLGYGCDEAVMEVVRRAPPWKPAIRDGIPVVQRFIIPVRI